MLVLTLMFTHKGEMWEVELRKGAEVGQVMTLNKHREEGLPAVKMIPQNNRTLLSHRNVTLEKACKDNQVPDDVKRWIDKEIDRQLTRRQGR